MTSSPNLSTQETLKPLLEAIESAKDGNIMTIRSLVLKVLSEPNLFAGYDQIKAALAPALEKGGPEGEKLAKTLDLFSYGNYNDYSQDGSPFLSLTDSQIFKLRQLTVISTVQSFALQKIRVIPYQEFQQALGLETGRKVEEVLISCIYAGVMGARLCQKTNALKIDPTHVLQSRDVPPQQVPVMIQQLQTMRQAIAQSQKTAQDSHQAVKRELKQYQAFCQQVEERKKTKAEPMGWADSMVENVTAAVRRQKRSRGGISGAADMGRFHL